MPDLRSLLPNDTIIVKVPIDAESLPGYIIIELVEKPKPHNFAPRTNQDVINLFAKVFDGPYIEVITRAGLSGIFAARKAVYEGPDVEGLTLTEAERERLIGAMD